MNISPNNEKIQKYLDELSEEYKELLFKALLERSKSIEDISITELLRLDNEIKKPLIENYQKQQKRRKMFFVYGLMYMFFGIIMLLMYYTIKSDIFHGTDGIVLLISIVVSVVGLFISAFSFVMPMSKANTSIQKISTQTEATKLLSFEVITKWRELEGIVSDLAENNSTPTPRSVIEYLSSNNFIDKSEYIILKDFLKMRNNIVHSSNIDISTDEIKTAINNVDQIIAKLKKIL